MEYTLDHRHLPWLEQTKKYRASLDMATILWEWRKHVDDFDAEAILYDLREFMDFETDVKVVNPRDELWGSLLGSCKLNNEYYSKRIRAKLPEVGIEVDQDDVLTVEGFAPTPRVKGTDPERNKFDIQRFYNLHADVIDSEQTYPTYSLNWFLQYRDYMSAVTPFADYCLIKKATEAVDVRLFFYEPFVAETLDDAVMIGMFDPDADEPFLFEEVCVEGAMVDDESMYLSSVTHFFVDLDHLIAECDRNKYPIPDAFRLPDEKAEEPVEQICVSGELPRLVFNDDSVFPLLEIAPTILEWIERDPVILDYLENKPQMTCRSAIVDRLYQKAKFTSIGMKNPQIVSKSSFDIITNVLLPKDKRNESTAYLRPLIELAIECLWSAEGIANLWKKKGVKIADRKKAFKEALDTEGIPHGDNEIINLVKLLSPIKINSYRNYSIKQWEDVREKLFALEPIRLM